MRQATVAVHFELYALRQGRWVMDACFADEDEAQAAAVRARHGADVRGVRLLRELNLPGTPEPVVTVVYDSTQAHETLVFKTAEAGGVPEHLPITSVRPKVHDHRHRHADVVATELPPLSMPGRLGYILGLTGLVLAGVVGWTVLH